MWKSKFYGTFVLNHRVNLHAIDATPARWCGDAGSSPLDGASTAASSPRNDFVKNCRVHPPHWLISTQVKVGAKCKVPWGDSSDEYDAEVVALHSVWKSTSESGMFSAQTRIHSTERSEQQTTTHQKLKGA